MSWTVSLMRHHRASSRSRGSGSKRSRRGASRRSRRHRWSRYPTTRRCRTSRTSVSGSWSRKVAEAAKTQESADRLAAEIERLRADVAEERVCYELRLAEARSAVAAKALIVEHDGAGTRRSVRRGRFGAQGMARHHRLGGQGVIRHGQQERIRQELHGDPGRGVPASIRLERAELAQAHGARGPKRQGGHDPEGLGVGPGELHAQRRLQDGLHRVRLQDEGLQLRPRHSAHGRRDGLAGADWRLPSSGFTTTQAFCGCSEALVGGNGTAWSKDAASGAYLRIDREGEPGYLMAG